MGDKRIFLRDTEILDEVKTSLNEINAVASGAVGQAREKIAAAISFLQERHEYWKSEYRYWYDRLIDSEGKINRHASDRMDLANEKIELIQIRLNNAHMFSESLQKHSSDSGNLNSKAQLGAAFLDLKKDQANIIMAIRISQGQFGQNNKTAISPISSGHKANSSGGHSSQEIFAQGVQAGIIAQYRNDISDENKKKDAATVSMEPFWKMSDLKAAGEYSNERIKVRFDASDKERIITHETFHRMSDNGGNERFSHSGIAVFHSDPSEKLGYRAANVHLNEGVTELYTKRYTEANGITSRNNYYTRNVDLAARLESVVGRHIMSKAYFKSKPSTLSNIFELAFNDSRAFTKFSKLVDVACGKGRIDSPEAALAYIKAQRILVDLRKNLIRRK